MKIALCLVGQARSVEAGYEFHKKNILDGNDVTAFFHTWASEDNLYAKALELYKPGNWSVEQSPNVDLSKYTNTPPPSPNWKVKDGRMSTYAQLYAIERCNSMKCIYEQEHKMTFDWVIRSRFDFAINARIPFDELDNSKLYIPNCRMVPTRDFGNDQFAFSSSENMDKYARAVEHIDEFYDSGIQYMCEDFMSANWKKYGLVGENLVYCDINHPFPPGEYNGTPHSLIRDDYAEWLK
jgi:hypothetical protein